MKLPVTSKATSKQTILNYAPSTISKQPFNDTATVLIKPHPPLKYNERIEEETRVAKTSLYLCQRLSVAIQHGNATAVL